MDGQLQTQPCPRTDPKLQPQQLSQPNKLHDDNGNEQPRHDTAKIIEVPSQTEISMTVVPKIEKDSERDEDSPWTEENEKELAEDMDVVNAMLSTLEEMHNNNQTITNNNDDDDDLSVDTGAAPMNTLVYLEGHYACPHEDCKVQFMEEGPLVAHLRTHKDTQVFQCRFCKKMFHLKDQFDDHLKMHKQEKKRFECSSCKRKFLSTNHLNRHLNVSCKEKGFRCCYCQEKYRNRCHLFRHLRIEHAKKESDIECAYCDTKCATLAQLNRHLGIHTL